MKKQCNGKNALSCHRYQVQLTYVADKEKVQTVFVKLKQAFKTKKKKKKREVSFFRK